MKSLTILLPLFICGCQAWQQVGYPGNQNWNKALLVQPQHWQQPQNAELQQKQVENQASKGPTVTMILDLPTLLKAMKELMTEDQKPEDQKVEDQKSIENEKEEDLDIDMEFEVSSFLKSMLGRCF